MNLIHYREQRKLHDIFPPYQPLNCLLEPIYKKQSLIEPLSPISKDYGILPVETLMGDAKINALNYLIEQVSIIPIHHYIEAIQDEYSEVMDNLNNLFDRGLESSPTFLEAILKQDQSQLPNDNANLFLAPKSPKTFKDVCRILFLNTLSLHSEDIIDDLTMSDKPSTKSDLKYIENWLATKDGLVYFAEINGIKFTPHGDLIDMCED